MLYQELKKINKNLSSSSRVQSTDFFRGIAIISVVLFHFNESLPYGYLGVDLFFVISGLLVSKPIFVSIQNGEPISIGNFFLRRGFKIWPSYYFFLLICIPLASLLSVFNTTNQNLSLNEIPSYVFMYRNYYSPKFHYIFEHVWSICVEEHFYILLPMSFFVLKKFGITQKNVLVFILFVIFISATYKFTSPLIEDNSVFSTHKRMDALGIGVLIQYLIVFHQKLISKLSNFKIAGLGLALFLFVLFLDQRIDGTYFHNSFFKLFIPISFGLIQIGMLNTPFVHFRFVKIASYYSYNWYLWHPITSYVLLYYLNPSIQTFTFYILFSFLIAMLVTLLIEIPFLKYRSKVLK